MRNRMLTAAAPRGAVVFGGVWLAAAVAAAGCDVTITAPPVALQGCSTSASSNFPIGGSLVLDLDSDCPLHTLGNESQYYAANVTLPNGSVQYNYVQLTGTNRTGNPLNVILDNAAWSINGQGKFFVQITGTYNMATGGFDGSNQGYDNIVNYFLLSSGASTTATAKISYIYGSPNNDLSTPASSVVGAAYTAKAVPHYASLAGPLTWRWYRNGALAATTSTASATLRAGNVANTNDQIMVTATDQYGHSSSSATQTMRVVSSTSCGTKIIC